MSSALLPLLTSVSAMVTFESVMHWDHFSYRSRQAVVPPAPGSRCLDPRPDWRLTWSSLVVIGVVVAVAVKLKAEIL